MAIQSALPEKRIDPLACVEARFVVKNVENAAALQIERNIFALGDRKQMPARFDCQAGRFNRVLPIISDIPDEFTHP